MNDTELLELTELFHALADGRLTERQRARLNAMLAASEEARRHYVRFAGLSAALGDYAAEQQTEAAPRIVRPPASVWGRRTAIFAAAAAVVLGLFLWLKPAAEDDDDTPDAVACLTGEQDAEWEGAAPQTGDYLQRGQRLELKRGIAEVTFDSGARAVLEGPTSLDLQSAWAVGLVSGTLTTSGPAESKGFRVRNNAVDVTNLGGKFSVVADRGGAEVFALDGSVEATGRTGGKQLLGGKQGRRFAIAGDSEISDLDRKLSRLTARALFQRRARPVNYVQSASGDFRGLRVPGLASGHARTISFWVRVPDDAESTDTTPLVAWNRREKKGLRNAQIAWNRDPESGPIGAVRTEHGNVVSVGRTSLRDGGWHHVAVVFLPGKKANGAAQVKQFVDGRLDATSQWKRRGRSEPLDDSTDMLWAGPRNTRSSLAAGEINRVIVADQALTPDEIEHLAQGAMLL